VGRGTVQKVTVVCPRCGGDAGVVLAWIETEYRSVYDEKAHADVGKVDVETKVAPDMHRSWTGSSTVLDHTCHEAPGG
jgi:hypothetical protein